jgi:6-pyruvoyltetrahydropterin/6-carboxytetrahydropterin synthase
MTQHKSFKARLSVEFSLDVAHFMPNFPKDHPNARMHGHSYFGEVVLVGEVNPKTGVVMGLDEVKVAIQEVVQALDHRLLNEIVGLELPTSENMARWMWNHLKPTVPQLVEVKLKRPSVGMTVSYFGEELDRGLL